MAKGNKTVPEPNDPRDFIAQVENPVRHRDANRLMSLFADIIGEPAKMWGSSIIGFGQYHYRYESGREGDMPLVGFSPRKAQTVIYLVGEIPDQAELLQQLGPHSMGKACLYVKDLDKVDMNILRELVEKSVAAQRAKYPQTK